MRSPRTAPPLLPTAADNNNSSDDTAADNQMNNETSTNETSSAAVANSAVYDNVTSASSAIGAENTSAGDEEEELTIEQYRSLSDDQKYKIYQRTMPNYCQSESAEHGFGHTRLFAASSNNNIRYQESNVEENFFGLFNERWREEKVQSGCENGWIEDGALEDYDDIEFDSTDFSLSDIRKVVDGTEIKCVHACGKYALSEV